MHGTFFKFSLHALISFTHTYTQSQSKTFLTDKFHLKYFVNIFFMNAWTVNKVFDFHTAYLTMLSSLENTHNNKHCLQLLSRFNHKLHFACMIASLIIIINSSTKCAHGMHYKGCNGKTRLNMQPYIDLPSASTVMFGESAAFQNTEIIFDFVGIPAKAVEKVLMVHGVEVSLLVEGKSRRGDQALGRDVTHSVTKDSQKFHLMKTEDKRLRCWRNAWRCVCIT